MSAGYELANDHVPFGHASSLFPFEIGFDPTDAACLSKGTDGRLTFRTLAPAELVSATLVVGVGGAAIGWDFAQVGAAGGVRLWELTVEPPADDFRYGLAFRLADETPVYWSPTGITNGFERLDHFRCIADEISVHTTPDWAKGCVIYQIFPDRFANGDPSIDPPDVVAWGSISHGRQFQGGDLAGVLDRADELADLGVGAVYLNPIFASPSTHRYDTVDYRSVDPALGGDDALVALVEGLHRRNIKVILDASINHCHPRFFAFADVVRNGSDSAYADWFVVHDWPISVLHRPHLAEPGSWAERMGEWFSDETGIPLVTAADDGPVFEPRFDAWYGVPTMPRVNLANPDARAYMLDTAAHWVREFDIDGWRMDVARYVDPDVWPDFRRRVRAARDDVYVLAEIMGDAGAWLQGDAFDATMNYTFRQLCLDHFATGTADGERFREGYLRMLAMYGPEVQAVSHNLIGSHDTARFRTLAGGDRRSLELATLFQMTTPGAPGLYYGDEIGMEGENDPFCRGAMDWDVVPTDPVRADRVRLAEVRARYAALRSPHIRLVAGTGETTVFVRPGAPDVVVAINPSDQPQSVRMPDVGEFGDIVVAHNRPTVDARAAKTPGNIVHLVGGDATCEDTTLHMDARTGAIIV